MLTPIQIALLENNNVDHGLHDTIRKPPTERHHWDEVTVYARHGGSGFDRQHVRLTFLLYLEHNPASFPADFDDIIKTALLAAFAPLALSLSGPLPPLLAKMPENRGEPLLSALVKRVTAMALWAGSPKSLGHLLEEGTVLVDRFRTQLIEDPSLAAKAIKLPELPNSEFWATDVLKLGLEMGQPYPDNLDKILSHEFFTMMGLGGIDVRRQRPSLRAALEALPEYQRIAIIRDQPYPAWNFIDLVPDPDFALETLRKSIAHEQPYRYKDGIKQAPQVDWVAEIVKIWPEAATKDAQYLVPLWLAKIMREHAMEMPLDALLTLMAEADIYAQHHLLVPIAARLSEADQPSLKDLFSTVPPEARVALTRLLTIYALRDDDKTPLEDCLEAETHPRVRLALQAGLERLDPDWPALCAKVDDWMSGEDIFENPLRNEELAWARTMITEGIWKNAYDSILVMDPLLALAPTNFGNMRVYPVKDLSEALAAQKHRATLSALLHRPFKPYRDAYERLAATVSIEVHLRALKEGTPALQRIAATHLSAHREAVLPDVFPLLKGRKAAQRAIAARLCELIGSPMAIAPLKAALKKEKASKPTEAMKSALAACSNVQQTQPSSAADRLKLHAPFTVSGGLEHLRAVLYAPATAMSWVELCHVLERFRLGGALDMAMDYLDSHNLDRWPEAQRCQPWGWRNDPVLSRVGDPSVGPGHWAVAATLTDETSRDAFLELGRNMFERRAKSRFLPTDMVPELLRWVETAWTWVEAQGLDLEDLSIRLDGGAKRGMGRPQSSSLSLYKGFGLHYERGGAFGGANVPANVPMVQWVRVKLPSGHILYDKHPEAAKPPHLELTRVLTLPDVDESA